MQGSAAAIADDAAAQFYAGYLWGAAQQDKKQYIAGCFQTDSDLNNLLDEIMNDYAQGDFETGDSKWDDTQPKFDVAIEQCSDVAQEFMDLRSYGNNVAKETIKARADKYKAQIDKISVSLITRWESGQYFDAGMFGGWISQYMGLVPNPYPDVVAVEEQRDPETVPQFTAGWLYGISWQQDDYRDKIVACYKSNNKLEDDYFNAMAAYEAGDQKKGDDLFADAAQYYEDAFSGCDKDITDALGEWNDKLTALGQIKDWDKISAKIYDAHKDELNADIGLEFKWWDAAVYFNSGMYAGRFHKVFIDNAPEAIIGEMLTYI